MLSAFTRYPWPGAGCSSRSAPSKNASRVVGTAMRAYHRIPMGEMRSPNGFRSGWYIGHPQSSVAEKNAPGSFGFSIQGFETTRHPAARVGLRWAAMPDADAAVREKALSLGFDAVGVARADVPLEEDFARFEAFVRAGYHGTMGYLAEHGPVRQGLSGPGILPGARSVVCVAQRYAVRLPGDPPGMVGRIARYARGLDYHKHVRRRLRKLADFVRSLEPGAVARPLVDTAPVLERAWAARAGLGFLGKNGMLIRPGLGSFTVIGEVVTSVRLTPDAPMMPRCGRCTACLRACPTEAFVSPYVLDARRCISYLTIEHRGAWQADARVAPWLFGCDVCQEVCPFNRAAGAWVEPGGPFDPLPRWQHIALADLATASPDQLDEMLQGSAMRRVRYEDWRRNVAGALGGELLGVAAGTDTGQERDP
ncbi:MAG: tRNA epoxyqueuosine(34) reductase QueG [Deltaproteobacteria bacterium HGW-Deltaproteobacteria-20]|nr:MAG: tRNA epoxyqueuosine(34) reductase QueG [Deltaproteobacteria bacterium HGW-Deltaproteobacteria-20]